MDALDALSKHCAALTLQKAARAITQIYNRTLKPSGLRITQLAILTSAARLDSPTVTEMARDLGMDRTSLSRGLRPLQRSGLHTFLQAETVERGAWSLPRREKWPSNLRCLHGKQRRPRSLPASDPGNSKRRSNVLPH